MVLFQYSIQYFSLVYLFFSLIRVHTYIHIHNRVYQHRESSIHSHPKLKHRNGGLYNDKSGGIKRKAKAYKYRDMFWLMKHATCIRMTAQAGRFNPIDIGQHAGNGVETKHSQAMQTFKYLVRAPTYWDFIPSTQLKIMFALSIKQTQTLLRKYETTPHNFKDWHIEFIKRIDAIHDDYKSLDRLDHKLDEFNHGFLHFDDIDRTLQKWFKGFEERHCIQRISPVLPGDYTLLLWIIYNHPETNYGDFAEPEFLIKNSKTLKFIQRKMKYRMSIQEIKITI